MSNRLSDKLIRVKLDEINRNLFNLMDSESMNIISKSIAEYAEEYAKFRLDKFISDHFPELDKDLENAIEPPDTISSTSTSYKGVSMSTEYDNISYFYNSPGKEKVSYKFTSPRYDVGLNIGNSYRSHLKKEAISELIKEALDNEDQTTFDELVEVYKGL